MAFVGELTLDDGSVLLLEVSGAAPEGVGRVSRVGTAVREAANTLQEALDRLRPALSAVVATVQGVAHSPESVTVEFGIKLTAEAGVVISKTAAEANFTVRAQWANPIASRSE